MRYVRARACERAVKRAAPGMVNHTTAFWVGVAIGLRVCGLDGVRTLSLMVFLTTVGYLALCIAYALVLLLLRATQATVDACRGAWRACAAPLRGASGNDSRVILRGQ